MNASCMPDSVRIWHKGDKEGWWVVTKKKKLNSRQRDPHGHNNRNHGVLSGNNKWAIGLG